MTLKQSDRKAQEIEKNFTYFQSILPTLAESHRGRYVLLQDANIVGIYDTVRDAQMTGAKFYKDGLFSIQQVESQPIDLGFFSHAVHLG